MPKLRFTKRAPGIAMYPLWISILVQPLARVSAYLTVLVLALGLSACSPKPDIKIGYLGGLSGKFSDLGTATRNGALLAVEVTNAKGGIAGRKLALIEQDDKQSNEHAVAAIAELKKQEVVAVIGPSTSSIAMAVMPSANESQLLLISPTVTTSKLTGKDDYFLRATGDASMYGAMAAQVHFTKRGVRSVAIMLDMANADYTESWGLPYAQEMRRLGGKVLLIDRFKSTDSPDHTSLARRLVTDKPDMVVLVASTVDSALLAQRVKQLRPNVLLAGSAWASTERLIELGGAAVEGMLFEQYFDRHDQSEKYKAFSARYTERFKAAPGFGAVLAYDAASMVIAGLEKNTDPRTLKSSIISIGSFEGVQNRVTIDAFGDATRNVYFGVVKDGAFAKLE
jgi:branched-chain amino acid transport system substrate-binding protein